MIVKPIKDISGRNIMNITLKRAAEIVDAFGNGNWDQTIPASRLQFEDFDHVTERGTGNIYKMMDSAKRLISQRLRLPADYLARCPRDLQAENLNYWLRTLGDAPLFCRFKDQSIRAFFTRRYKPIDHTDVMEMVLDSFAPHTRVEFKISNEMMLLNIPDHSMTFKVFDDQMVPGCHFSNSEVGLVAYSCSVFYQRLICTNGLISADTIAVKTRHIKRNALDDFNATMDEVRRLALTQEGKMRLSIESKVDDPRASIMTFGRRFGHTGEETQEVQNAWEHEPAYTLWSVIQAFTYAAKAGHLSAEQAYRFQRTGGMILSLVK
jgi:hypothetical protein